MTTRYLFAYYTLDSQVSLSPSMSMKTGLFFFLTFCYIITPIFGIYYTSLLCYGNLKKKQKKKKKKTGENRTNQEQYALEVRKTFTTASLGSNFSGYYKRKSV